ncbi:THO complex subunit 2, partial [Biomphalaria glabrata]
NTVETYDPELSKRRKSENHYLASRKQNGEANGSSKMYAERDYKEKSKQQSHSSKSK